MSISHKAAIVVGAEWSSVFATRDNELYNKIKQLVDEDELEDFPPCYDGDGEGVFGYELESTLRNSVSELDFIEMNERISYLKQEFEKLTGMQAKVYLTPIVY